MSQTPPPPTTTESALPQTALIAVPAVAGLALVAAATWWVRRRSARRSAPTPQSQWMRKLVANLDLNTARHEVLGFVRDTLVGLDKGGVRSLLGPPAAAAERGVIVGDPPPARQDVAEQWYYRLENLDPERRDGASLVIDFGDDDAADDARFLLPPKK